MKIINNRKIHIRHLGPINNSEFEEKYEVFLDYAFKESAIHNIAITAPKGAGKSSVLRTYLDKKGMSAKVLNITVGAFETNISETLDEHDDSDVIRVITNDSEGKDAKDMGQEVEIKILNQIIQQIDPERIPESRFHIDREHQKGKTYKRGLFACMAFICIVYLALFSDYNRDSVYVQFSNVYLQHIMNFLYNPITLLVIILILAGVVFMGVTEFFKNYTHKRIPKFTLKDCSIDPIDDNQDTMFNRYLDEILYMLINSGYKTLIFEDMDRLKDYSIWEKLRDINIILNKRIEIYRRREEILLQKKNKLQKEAEKNKLIKLRLKIKGFKEKIFQKSILLQHHNTMPIKFVYVMNDSLFKSKDRVKFFDYIIPIIPIVDKSNSMDMIMNISKEYFSLNQAFLSSINDALDDMRLIYNIFNEMSVYKLQLVKDEEQAEPLDDNKLFAFVLYKNMLPQDFEKFQYYDGVVYEILNEFETLRQKALDLCGDNISESQRLLYAKPDEFAYLNNKKTADLYSEMTAKVATQINMWSDTERKLIQSLIMMGYLTIEDTQYTSYFYQANMNSEEREFVLKLKHNQRVDINQKLEHVSFVAKSLGRYLDYGNILNCDLVYYILNYDIVHENSVYELIRSTKDYEFIEKFIEYLKSKDLEKLYQFIDRLNRSWDMVFYEMMNGSLENLCLTYAQLSLCHSDVDVINGINYENCLTQYLSKVTSFRGE